jgi:hypothetical protein
MYFNKFKGELIFDMETSFSKVGTKLIISLRGKIDSDFKLPEDVLNLLKEDNTIFEIVFVLRKLKDFDAKGLKLWKKQVLEFIKNNYTVTFIESLRTLIEPIMEIEESNVKIRSFLVPYFCDDCNEEYQQIIDTSSLSMSFSSYSKPLCPVCGKRLSIDITENEIEKIKDLLPATEGYSDKRKYPRFDMAAYSIKVKVKTEKGIQICKLINFSEIGLCISCDELLPLNVKIDFEIEDRGKKAKTSGEIVWFSKEEDRRYLMGVSTENRDLFFLLIKS